MLNLRPLLLLLRPATILSPQTTGTEFRVAHINPGKPSVYIQLGANKAGQDRIHLALINNTNWRIVVDADGARRINAHKKGADAHYYWEEVGLDYPLRPCAIINTTSTLPTASTQINSCVEDDKQWASFPAPTKKGYGDVITEVSVGPGEMLEFDVPFDEFTPRACLRLPFKFGWEVNRALPEPNHEVTFSYDELPTEVQKFKFHPYRP